MMTTALLAATSRVCGFDRKSTACGGFVQNAGANVHTHALTHRRMCAMNTTLPPGTTQTLHACSYLRNVIQHRQMRAKRNGISTFANTNTHGDELISEFNYRIMPT